MTDIETGFNSEPLRSGASAEGRLTFGSTAEARAFLLARRMTVAEAPPIYIRDDCGEDRYLGHISITAGPDGAAVYSGHCLVVV